MLQTLFDAAGGLWKSNDWTYLRDDRRRPELNNGE